MGDELLLKRSPDKHQKLVYIISCFGQVCLVAKMLPELSKPCQRSREMENSFRTVSTDK